MSPRGLSQRERALAAWLAVCVIWGTTYLGIRVSIETMPPFLMAGLRWTAAGLLLGAIVLATGRPLPPRSAWPAIAAIGVLLLVVGNGAVVWAEQYVTSGLTAVIIATSPFWMVGADALLGGERITRRTLAGLTIGFCGIIMLVWPELRAGGRAGAAFLAGVVALQVAEVGWSLGSFWSKRISHAHDVFAATALQMLVAGGVLLALGTAAGEWRNLHFSTRSLSAFLYLVSVGSIGAYAAYAYALKHLPMALVSLYAYINPIIAVVLGMIVLGEPFTGRMALAAAIVLMGVAVVRQEAAPEPRKGARRAAA